MRYRKGLVRTLAVVVFAAGVLLGLALVTGATWADLEASLFDSSMTADEALGTLRCPVLITRTESGTISATIKNPTERRKNRYVRAHISQGYLTVMREENTKFEVESGAKRELEWGVNPEDAVYGRMILARIHVFGSYPLPAMHQSCGILVLDVPGLSGRAFVALVVVVSCLLMAIGLGLWSVAERPMLRRARNASAAMVAMAVIVVLGLLTIAVGWWEAGVLSLVVVVLLLGGIIAHFSLN
jgi:hypothetical protein